MKVEDRRQPAHIDGQMDVWDCIQEAEQSRLDKFSWAVGLFEGEGSLWLRKLKMGRVHLTVALVTTDYDVLQAFHEIVVVGRINGPYAYKTAAGRDRKPFWRWYANGEHAEELIRDFRPYLHERRGAQVDKALSGLRNNRFPEMPRDPATGRYAEWKP